MSKGRRRKAWAAQAVRKRNPDAWFHYPAVSPKPKQGRRMRALIAVGGRGRP